jgi:hypothetical protein
MQYENVIFPGSVGFQCKNCGVCCRDEPSDINLKEQQRIEAKGFVNFWKTLIILITGIFAERKTGAVSF